MCKMMSFCFGEVVDHSTLTRMAEYEGKQITTRDIAYEAYRRKEGIYEAAQKQISDTLSKDPDHCTRCWIYNASGGPVTFVASHDWAGHIHPSYTYPSCISNGEWVTFLHEGDRDYQRSSGAVIYQGNTAEGAGATWVLSWNFFWEFGNHIVPTRKVFFGWYFR